VGLTGPNAAGKGEVAQLLTAQGYAYHSLSDVVREEAGARGLTVSRENLVLIGNELRRNGGPGALVDRLAPRLTPPAVIDSVRNPGEVEALRRLERFYLLGVRAPAEVRFQRIRSRGRLGDIRTLAEFRAYERRENSSAAGEQRILATLDLADGVVDNDTTLAALHRRVRELLDSAAGGS
jgi:dephospho-CoA kinase